MALGLNSLSAGGTTSVRVNLVDAAGYPVTDDVTVNFFSKCAMLGLAEIESPATVSNGRVLVSYTAKGCVGADTITAFVTQPWLTAAAEVTIAAAEAGAIRFDGSDPDIISLRGVGGTEMATLTFLVEDTGRAPLRGQPVSFTLNHDNGGVELLDSDGVTDESGRVRARVRAGTVVTPVVVTAMLPGGTATQSSGLKVSSGTPDYDSFSISADMLNPEAWNKDGVEVNVTVRLADHFNNRVPDGTVVTFMAEGGSIDDAGNVCKTVNGACSVTWISQDPRPVNGRVSILAYAVGDESFVDNNGNGRFDEGESFTDIGNPFLDKNESGAWDAGEPFVDTDGTGQYSLPNGQYDGILCADRATNADCGERSTHIFRNITLIMSGSEVDATRLNERFTPGNAAGPIMLWPDDDGLVKASYELTIADYRGQIMPAGTTIEAELTHGSFVGPNSYTVANTSVPAGTEPRYVFEIEGDGDEGNGYLSIKVTTPDGIISYLPAVPVRELNAAP